MISSNDFPFRTDGAALASGALAVAGVGVSVFGVEVDAAAPGAAGVADVSPGFAAAGAPNRPVVGAPPVVVVGLAPNNGAGVVVSVVEAGVGVAVLSPG